MSQIRLTFLEPFPKTLTSRHPGVPQKASSLLTPPSCMPSIYLFIFLLKSVLKSRAEQRQHQYHPPPLRPACAVSRTASVLCSIEPGKINGCRVGVGRSSCVSKRACVHNSPARLSDLADGSELALVRYLPKSLPTTLHVSY